MCSNLWKTVCSERNIAFLFKVLSRILLSFSLIFWEIFRVVLLIKNLLIKKRANSNLNVDRNNFLANKTVRLILGLYL